MPSLDIKLIPWFFIALAFLFGMSWFVLSEFFRKKDLAKLLHDGQKGEAKILGYEWRGEGKGRHFVVIFQFSPIDAPEPISYSKTIWGKIRPTPGSMVSLHYNATFPMLSAIDSLGLRQSIESLPDSFRNSNVNPQSSHGKPPRTAFALSFTFLLIGVFFEISGPTTRDDLIAVNGSVISVEKFHQRSDFLRILIKKQNGEVKLVRMYSLGKELELFEGLKPTDEIQILAEKDAGALKILGLKANDVVIRPVDQALAYKRRDYKNATKMLFYVAGLMFLFGLFGLIKRFRF